MCLCSHYVHSYYPLDDRLLLGRESIREATTGPVVLKGVQRIIVHTVQFNFTVALLTGSSLLTLFTIVQS